MEVIDHLIGGASPGLGSDRMGEVYDPATGEVTKRVAFASPEVVDRAVRAATEAFEEWRHVSLSKRARILFAFRELVESHKDELARIITSEHGKVISDAEGEVSRGQEVVEFSCGIPHLLKGEYSENVSSKVDSYSIRQPVGVVAGITPFNFPAMVPMWMFPVAIACGNAFVLKPSEKDPSAAMFMGELWREAGLPDGVYNVVHGDKVAVDGLLHHPGVAAISSVGSTPVARYIYENAAARGKRVQALGGAKNHMIVLPDADMDLAADAAVGAGYGSSGQRCMAISAVVAVGDAGDALLERMRARIESLEVGPGTSPRAEMGPLVTGQHRDKVLSYVEAGVREGAELAIDGRDVSVEGHEGGFFLGPCLFDRVTPEMSVYRDEIFGPVLVMLRASSYPEAISLVNANPFGNGTAVFTNDGGAARKFVHEVEVGMVGINVPIPVPMAFYSFGGWKQSLFGDSHVHGTEGVRFYTRAKVVTSRWPDPESRGVNLGFPRNE
ncbi:MAG TPA: CoA-acylating methylmalonate-semialdehyde dehydrogenase [Actinomycetota bacterium]|nr:CoA-acylating methylmalonate-semialdehyde dehydrogenase [Actinomycetota bacterium]